MPTNSRDTFRAIARSAPGHTVPAANRWLSFSNALLGDLASGEDERRSTLDQAAAALQMAAHPELRADGPLEAPSFKLAAGLSARLVALGAGTDTGAECLELRDAQGSLVFALADTGLSHMLSRLPISPAAFLLMKARSACVETGQPFEPPDPPNLTEIGTRARLAEASVYYKDRLLSRNVRGTCSGTLACAWAVNYVVNEAVGSPIGGGLSTIEMHEALAAGRGANETRETVQPGDIVLSPSAAGTHGHVGILGPENHIYSNNSKTGTWSDFYTVDSWIDHFSSHGLLETLFYRLAG